MFHMFQSAAFKALYKLGIFPLNRLSQIPYMDSCILKTLSANSWHVSLQWFQQNNWKQSGDQMLERLLISVFFIKNLGSFQVPRNQCVPHKTWNHPTSNHPKPYRKRKKLPCLFSPGRLVQSFHRPGFGRWSWEECHRNQRYLCSNEWRLHVWAALEPRAAWDWTKRVWKEVWDLWWNWKFMENGSFYEVSRVGYLKYPFWGGIDTEVIV